MGIDFLEYKNFLAHSAKGSTWKNHKYLKKVNGTYYYATKEDLAKVDRHNNLAKKLENDSANQYNKAVLRGIDAAGKDNDVESAQKKYDSAKEAYDKSNTFNRKSREKDLKEAEAKLNKAKSSYEKTMAEGKQAEQRMNDDKSAAAKLKESNDQYKLSTQIKNMPKDTVDKGKNFVDGLLGKVSDKLEQQKRVNEEMKKIKNGKSKKVGNNLYVNVE